MLVFSMQHLCRVYPDNRACRILYIISIFCIVKVIKQQFLSIFCHFRLQKVEKRLIQSQISLGGIKMFVVFFPIKKQLQFKLFQAESAKNKKYDTLTSSSTHFSKFLKTFSCWFYLSSLNDVFGFELTGTEAALHQTRGALAARHIQLFLVSSE